MVGRHLFLDKQLMFGMQGSACYSEAFGLRYRGPEGTAHTAQAMQLCQAEPEPGPRGRIQGEAQVGCSGTKPLPPQGPALAGPAVQGVFS